MTTSPSSLPKQRTSASLWEVEAALQVAYNALDDNDAADIPDVRTLIENFLTAKGEALGKRDRFASFLRVTGAWEEHLSDEIALLEEKRRRAKAVRERLQLYAIEVMRALGVRELAGETYRLRLVKNPPRVTIALDAEIPEEYIRTKVERSPDLVALRAALSKGILLRGVQLVQGERLEAK